MFKMLCQFSQKIDLRTIYVLFVTMNHHLLNHYSNDLFSRSQVVQARQFVWLQLKIINFYVAVELYVGGYRETYPRRDYESLLNI